MDSVESPLEQRFQEARKRYWKATTFLGEPGPTEEQLSALRTAEDALARARRSRVLVWLRNRALVLGWLLVLFCSYSHQ